MIFLKKLNNIKLNNKKYKRMKLVILFIKLNNRYKKIIQNSKKNIIFSTNPPNKTQSAKKI